MRLTTVPKDSDRRLRSASSLRDWVLSITTVGSEHLRDWSAPLYQEHQHSSSPLSLHPRENIQSEVERPPTKLEEMICLGRNWIWTSAAWICSALLTRSTIPATSALQHRSQIMDFIQTPVGADDDDTRRRTNLNNSLGIRQLLREAIQSNPILSLPARQYKRKKVSTTGRAGLSNKKLRC